MVCWVVVCYWNYYFPRSTNKIKFPHLSKFINLMKNLNFEHQSIFPLWGRVKLNFMDRYRKPNIFSENSSHCQVFPPHCQKMTLWHKKENHYPPRWICITHIWSPTLFPRKIVIFQGVLTKFKFLMKFPHLEKNFNLMKDLKYEHQSIFPCGGGSNLILGTGSENQIFFLRTPVAVKCFHQIVEK